MSPRATKSPERKPKAAKPRDSKTPARAPRASKEAKPRAAQKSKPVEKLAAGETQAIPQAMSLAPTRQWTNQEIAGLLSRIADILSIQGEIAFKIVAYRRAADIIDHLSRSVQDIWAGDA